MKNKITFFTGILCSMIGIFVLLMNVSVSSWGFYRIGRVNSGGILFVLFILSMIYLVAKRNKTGAFLAAASVGLLLLSLICGIHMHFIGISAFEMFLIVGLIGAGLGLIVKSFL